MPADGAGVVAPPAPVAQPSRMTQPMGQPKPVVQPLAMAQPTVTAAALAAPATVSVPLVAAVAVADPPVDTAAPLPDFEQVASVRISRSPCARRGPFPVRRSRSPECGLLDILNGWGDLTPEDMKRLELFRPDRLSARSRGRRSCQNPDPTKPRPG